MFETRATERHSSRVPLTVGMAEHVGPKDRPSGVAGNIEGWRAIGEGAVSVPAAGNTWVAPHHEDRESGSFPAPSSGLHRALPPTVQESAGGARPVKRKMGLKLPRGPGPVQNVTSRPTSFTSAGVSTRKAGSSPTIPTSIVCSVISPSKPSRIVSNAVWIASSNSTSSLYLFSRKLRAFLKFLPDGRSLPAVVGSGRIYLKQLGPLVIIPGY